MAKAPKKLDELKKELAEVEAKKAAEEVAAKPEKIVKQTPKKATTIKREEQSIIADNDGILIMNNTTGRWGFTSSRTGYSMILEDYGSEDYIPYSELRTMNSTERAHIEKAYIIILDERAVEQLGHGKLYESILDLESVKAIVQDPALLEMYLPRMPKTMKETVCSLIIQGFKNRTITNVLVRDVIEKHLGVQIDI